MRKLFAVLKLLMDNKLNRKNRIAALFRFFRWQIGSWLVPGKVLIPWINGSRIFAGFMMSGSAGCAYSGLHEFEEMAFVLHFLRDEDLFMDIGANVGVFTVLAGSAVGAKCISVEPGAEAFLHLQDNIAISKMEDRVRAIKACISDEDGVCRFALSSESTLSHIASPDDMEALAEIETKRIDSILAGKVPAMLKIDVEGFEKQALEGASQTLKNSDLKVVLLEIGSHSRRYGIEPIEIHQIMVAHDFNPCSYDPFSRKLTKLESYSKTDNTLYIRDFDFIRARLEEAAGFAVFGHKI